MNDAERREISATLLALGAAFSVGAVYSQLSAEVRLHNHPVVMAELAEIKGMVARIDERTK